RSICSLTSRPFWIKYLTDSMPHGQVCPGLRMASPRMIKKHCARYLISSWHNIKNESGLFMVMPKRNAVLKIIGWGLLAVGLVFALRQIGHDVRTVHKKLETRRLKTGECHIRRLCRLRSKKQHEATLE